LFIFGHSIENGSVKIKYVITNDKPIANPNENAKQFNQDDF
jgi:hypothetical protein